MVGTASPPLIMYIGHTLRVHLYVTLQGYQATKANVSRTTPEDQNKSKAEQVKQKNDNEPKTKVDLLDAQLFQARHPKNSANEELT